MLRPAPSLVIVQEHCVFPLNVEGSTGGTRISVTVLDPVIRISQRTSDMDVAHDDVASAFAPHELQIADAHALDFRLDVVATDNLATGIMAYGTAATMLAPAMERRYHLNFPVRGDTTVAQGNARRSFSGGHTGVAFGPSAPVFLRWSADSEQYHLNVSQARLETHASKLLGSPVDGDIGFDLTFDLDTPRGRTVLSMTRFLHAELSRDDGIASVPIALHEFESALMTQLLMTIPNRFTPLLNAPTQRNPRERIRDAVDYIREHAQDELSVADIAAAVGLSVRALQVGFQREAGASPMEFVRSIRLDLAHRDLVLGAGAVNEVAHRWHFHHVGRFASLYMARFGTHPSQTLRNRRGAH